MVSVEYYNRVFPCNEGQTVLDVLIENGQDIQASISKAAELCDSFRNRNLSHAEKPALIFLLRYIIMILSYNNFKESIKAK